jgi:hypothetical protein
VPQTIIPAGTTEDKIKAWQDVVDQLDRQNSVANAANAVDQNKRDPAIKRRVSSADLITIVLAVLWIGTLPWSSMFANGLTRKDVAYVVGPAVILAVYILTYVFKTKNPQNKPSQLTQFDILVEVLDEARERLEGWQRRKSQPHGGPDTQSSHQHEEERLDHPEFDPLMPAKSKFFSFDNLLVAALIVMLIYMAYQAKIPGRHGF